MWGAIIGAAVSLASSVAGGIASSNQAKKAEAVLEQQKGENQAWYDRRYNERFIDRVDAQSSLTEARDSALQLYNQSAGASAVTGATDEASALQKAAGNKLISDTVTGISAQGTAYKEGVEDSFRKTDSEIAAAERARYMEKAAGISSAASGLSQVGSSLSTAFSKKE